MINDTVNDFKKGCLVIYKTGPAKVLKTGDKIEIQLADNKTIMVRSKDIAFLHPGPVDDLSSLGSQGEENNRIKEACEILQGETLNLKEFAELAYNAFTPQSAWSVYQGLLDSFYITGTADKIIIRTEDEVEQEKAARKLKTDEKAAWNNFTANVKNGKISADDNKYLRDLELFALGRPGGSRLFKEIKMQETVENAHSLLLRLKYWDNCVNPYINRLGFSIDNKYPDINISTDEIFTGGRLDLTHLDSYAIDDEGNSDPDDALSFEGGKLWVHIADPSCAVVPGSDADIYAMNQGAKIYLPEIKIQMLSQNMTDIFGLGLRGESPALSFCISQNIDGSIVSCGIHFSRIKVKRITYKQAQESINTYPFADILEMAKKYKKRREAGGASSFDFPEVNIKVENNKVSITQFRRYESTMMVQESMLMAGEAAAAWADENNIPYIFSTQPGNYGDNQETGSDRSSGSDELPGKAGNAADNAADSAAEADLASMFALRKKMKPGIIKSVSDVHSGLGLPSYSRVTSPLRRYLDLAAHQQIRLSLTGKKILTNDEIISRIGAASAGASSVQKLEKLSNMHWTLVYLIQNPGWEGKGIIVERRGRSDTIIIPELGFETSVPAQSRKTVNDEITLKAAGIDLPNLKGYFTVI
ncbi:MAG: RNB domain-containing ribonuclease [Spirochaetia bacterium]|jgi:exoribonuclease-2|nr:RNB domain-containing ribonuclease [Spirochaetia bacterium]